MSQPIIIQSNIPLPGPSKWEGLYKQMEIGDSILIAASEAGSARSQAKRSRIKVVTKTTGPNEMRLWRVK